MRGFPPLIRRLFLLLLVLWESGGFPMVPEDCVPSDFMEEEGISLKCSLSAINSALEKTNFSVIPSRHTRGLSVACSDSETLSSLEPGGFISLSKLRTLEIRGCRLQVLPNEAFAGLRGLRELKIRSSASQLSLEGDALAGLPSLSLLDLSGNGILSLPEKALCHLPNLRTLNLSHNEVDSSLNLGHSDCLSRLSGLRTLDISHNKIWSFKFQNPEVQSILVNDNYLSMLEEDGIRGSVKLKKLDFSNNIIETFPRTFFADVPRLEKLIISNNSISSLQDDIFINQSALAELNLSGNLLQTLSAKTLSSCAISLTTLDLASNELTSLDPELFKGFHSLVTLKLSQNNLRSIPELGEIGESLKNLHLSNNHLGPVIKNSFVFENLASLSHLTLDQNELEFVPSELFANLTNGITVLDLSRNNLATIPEAVRSLHNLQSFSIGMNKIKELGALSMEHLWRFQADQNEISSISANNFQDLSSLQVLDLSSNRIKTIDKEIFSKNTRLQAVRLDNNQISAMDFIFQDLPNLTWLNISANSISVFDYSMIPKALQWLDLHSNELISLDNHFSLEDNVQLGHLDASFNQIKEIGPQNIPNHIVTLLLNDNHIVHMGPYTFFKKWKLKKVDLTLNRMESISSNALRLSSDMENGVKSLFYFGGNPIRCDCQMSWFKGINAASGLQNFPIVADLESIYCRLVYSREQSFVPLVDADSENFLCSYKTHCFALCHCCDYDACDCEMTCPNNCTCYHDNSWAKNIAECSLSKFKDLPDRLPMDATEIFLDGNDIGMLKSHTFIGRKNLKMLYLNDSSIHFVPNNSFNGLTSLEELHLEDNVLTKLKGEEFNGLVELRTLHLQNNRISSINNSTFRSLKRLKSLFLQGNLISNFPPWELILNPLLNTVSFDGNPWNCDCQFMRGFENWINNFEGMIFEKESITCVDGINLINNPCISVTATTHVQNFNEKDNNRISSSSDLLLPIIASSTVLLCVILVIFIVIFAFRYEVRVWIHSKYGLRFFQGLDPEESASEKSKMFDAFFAYSNNDDMFVRQVLAPELEHSSRQYKLCLLYRDLPIQPSYVADTIVQASKASRRTVLVLSENFLKSEWSRYNYKSGLHQALGSFKNAQHLIVIILGNVSFRDLDPDLRHYFNTSRVLRWKDKLFWDKLRYSLPDVLLSGDVNDSSVIDLQDSSAHRHSSTYSFNYESCHQSDTSTRTMTIHI